MFPGGLVFDSNGNLYISHYARDPVLKVIPTNVVSVSPVVAPVQRPS
jgi:hypothetical protein